MSPCTKKVIITIFTQSLKVLIWSFWENAVVVRMIRSTGTDPFLSPNKKHGQRIIIPQTYFCQQVKTNHQHHPWTQSWKWKPHAWYLVGCTTTLTLMTQLHRILTQVFLSRSWKNIKHRLDCMTTYHIELYLILTVAFFLLLGFLLFLTAILAFPLPSSFLSRLLFHHFFFCEQNNTAQFISSSWITKASPSTIVAKSNTSFTLKTDLTLSLPSLWQNTTRPLY